MATVALYLRVDPALAERITAYATKRLHTRQQACIELMTVALDAAAKRGKGRKVRR